MTVMDSFPCVVLPVCSGGETGQSSSPGKCVSWCVLIQGAQHKPCGLLQAGSKNGLAHARGAGLSDSRRTEVRSGST